MKEIAENIIKTKTKEVGGKFKEQTAGYITAALGLVAGLAWSDAIKGLIEYLFPVSKDTLLARFIYAALITLAVILVSKWLMTALRGSSDKKN